MQQQHEQKKMGGNSGPLKPETVLRLSGWLAIYSHRFFFIQEGSAVVLLSHWHCISHRLSALYCNTLSNRLNAAMRSFKCIKLNQ